MASIDGTVQAVNAVTGSVDWTANACNTGEQTTAPAFAAAKVWVGLDDPGTAGITSSGSTVACSPSDLYTSPPSTYNGVVFAGGADGVVVAIKAGSSTILWQTCVGCARSGGPTLASPAVSTDGKWLFIGSPATGDVYKLNAQTGALVWTRFVDSCGTSAVTVSGSSLLVSGCAVYALSAANGAILWHSSKVGSSISVPAVANGLVFVTAVGNYAGTFALSASTGKTVWSQPDFLGQLFAPAIANGVVYVDFPEHQQPRHVQQQHWCSDRERGDLAPACVHRKPGRRQWTCLRLHVQLRDRQRLSPRGSCAPDTTIPTQQPHQAERCTRIAGPG